MEAERVGAVQQVFGVALNMETGRKAPDEEQQNTDKRGKRCGVIDNGETDIGADKQDKGGQ